MSSSLRIIVFLFCALPACSHTTLMTEQIQTGNRDDMQLRNARSSVGYDARILKQPPPASRPAPRCADWQLETAAGCHPVMPVGSNRGLRLDGILAIHDSTARPPFVCAEALPACSHTTLMTERSQTGNRDDMQRRNAQPPPASRPAPRCADWQLETAAGCHPIMPVGSNLGLRLDGMLAIHDSPARPPFVCADLISEKPEDCQRPVIPLNEPGLDHDAGAPEKTFELEEIVPPPNHTIRTVTILAGASVAGLLTYYLLPESVTGFDKSRVFKDDAFENPKRAFTTPPVVDKDAPLINYLAHPYFGMHYYLTQRNYNESVLWSFIFSTLISIGFEYAVEVFGEQPSIQDLVLTPVVGSVLGELNYQLTQRMRKDGFTTFEKIVVTILNPLYVLQNGYR